jgi:hypothetical protein
MPVSRGLLLSYVGLPPAWDTADTELLNAAVAKNLDRALKTIKVTDKGGAVFVSGDGAYIVNALEGIGVDISEMKGYDFADYFADKFNNEKADVEVVAKKFTFVYNVGTESALKKDFSAQLLKGIIKKATNQNCWVFVVSDMSATMFDKEYGFKLSNSITLPPKRERKVF